MNGIKTIGIDARAPSTGIRRYTLEVINGVLKLDSNNKYVIFLLKDDFKKLEFGNPNVKKVLADFRWYTLKEQIVMPYLIWKEKIDLMHFPHFNVPVFCTKKFVVTIHDLILTKFPSVRASTLSPLIYKIKNLAYNFIIKTALKRSKKIIAVSEFTKNDIIDQFGINKEKIIVTHESVSERLKQAENLDDKKVLSRYNIHRPARHGQSMAGGPFFFYAGNAYPHKNLDGLIRIYPKIKEKFKDLQLVLVGKEDYFYERLKKESPKDVIFTGFITDEELAVMYKNALFYIFPSMYEGFGLPPLEAMANGCPVLSSNRSSMPEILGSAALYFDPENDDEIVGQITKIVEDENLRKELIQKGKNQVKKYSWETCARKTLEIYNSI